MRPAIKFPRSISYIEDAPQHKSTHLNAYEFYGGREFHSRSRTYSESNSHAPLRPPTFQNESYKRHRRLSHDESTNKTEQFILDVDASLEFVLDQEDTDRDFQIHVTDGGPKHLRLRTATSNGYRTYDIRGTYAVSNFLQELALAKDYNRRNIVLPLSRLLENPVEKLSRRIKSSFWRNLTRRIDAKGLKRICEDPKNRSSHANPRIYVPHGEPAMAEYYRDVAKRMPDLHLEVEVLPPKPDDPVFVKSLNDKPGLLALAMREVDDGQGGKTLKGIRFVVPGARFNELYNWDSYFISLGLLADGHVQLAKGMVDHFVFEIKHYNKILNGSRSYYLCRSQPPFLTDMTLQIYHRLDPANHKENRAWLKRAIQAAIKEYHTVWMAEPRFDPHTGLSRYRPDGLGIPPETEASHFLHVLEPYATKHGISVVEFCEAYNDGTVAEPELDEYFLHDRAVRESGHDTTYRLEKRCANLGTVDLQACLYKFEIDIATTIRDMFRDEMELEEEFSLAPFPPTVEAYKSTRRARSTKTVQRSDDWFDRAEFRKRAIDKYLWHEGKGLYYDYDTVKRKQKLYESSTAYWMLWAGASSSKQAKSLVEKSLHKFEMLGGLVSGTEMSRGTISLERPNRQWDYPYGWPPHQMLAWAGLQKYGYLPDAQRLAYRFLYMMTCTFADYNGVVPEKFDAVKISHKVDAEYGNQGVDFQMVAREGFGWMNAAYQVGLTYITNHMRRALGVLISPELFFSTSKKSKRKMNELMILHSPRAVNLDRDNSTSESYQIDNLRTPRADPLKSPLAPSMMSPLALPPRSPRVTFARSPLPTPVYR